MDGETCASKTHMFFQQNQSTVLTNTKSFLLRQAQSYKSSLIWKRWRERERERERESNALLTRFCKSVYQQRAETV